MDWLAWLLAIPTFLLSIFSALFDNQLFLVLASVLASLLYFYGALSLIIYMLGDTKVTTDELFAAGATFTLLAWGFAHAYFVCLSIIPDSIINGLIQDNLLPLLSCYF